MTFVEGEGRGGWTLRGKENGMTSYGFVEGTAPSQWDGAAGDVSEWHNRVRRGVRAIDGLLTLAGVPRAGGSAATYAAAETYDAGTYAGTGVGAVFDDSMRDRAKAYQASVGIVSSFGYVGPITMRSLVLPVAQSAAAEQGLAVRWVLAQIEKESNFDPGAQGWTHPPDSGLVQWNTEATDTSLAEAYDPVIAIRKAAIRFRTARDKYLSVKPDNRWLALTCAIASHNAPAWADQWHSDEVAPNSTIFEYVMLTREFARKWQKALQ